MPNLNPAELAALVTILAQLYPAEEDLTRLLDWVDLASGLVSMDHKAYNRWHSTAREAMLQGKLAALVRIAAQEYPANDRLPYFRRRLEPDTHGQ